MIFNVKEIQKNYLQNVIHFKYKVAVEVFTISSVKYVTQIHLH